MTTRPMCCVSFRPMFRQDLPPSMDLYTPSPHETLLRGLASPVPTQTMSGLDGATATSPMEEVPWCSKTAAQVVPASVLFHTPPEAAATYIRFALPAATATAV